jgi:hypothetical protein
MTTSDHKLTWPTGGFVIDGKSAKKVEDAIKEFGWGGFGWDDKGSFTSNLLRFIEWVEEYYEYHDPWSSRCWSFRCYCGECD